MEINGELARKITDKTRKPFAVIAVLAASGALAACGGNDVSGAEPACANWAEAALSSDPTEGQCPPQQSSIEIGS